MFALTLDSMLGREFNSQRNLLRWSEQIDNAAWTKVASTVTANAIIAPDGNSTADRLVENTATGQHNTLQSSTVVANTPYTLSTFVRADQRDKIWLQAANGSFTSGFRTLADVTAQTATTATFGTGTASAATITSVGNGWFRVSVTGVIDATSTSLVFGVFMRDAAGADSYAGDGTSGLFLWGAQLEPGAFLTPYQQKS